MLQVDELQGLVYSFAGTFDAATYTVKAAESRARAEALGAERRMLESRTRRRNEVEEHVRRARRLALERRLRELAAEHEPVGARPSRVAFAAMRLLNMNDRYGSVSSCFARPAAGLSSLLVSRHAWPTRNSSDAKSGSTNCFIITHPYSW